MLKKNIHCIHLFLLCLILAGCQFFNKRSLDEESEIRAKSIWKKHLKAIDGNIQKMKKVKTFSVEYKTEYRGSQVVIHSISKIKNPGKLNRGYTLTDGTQVSAVYNNGYGFFQIGKAKLPLTKNEIKNYQAESSFEPVITSLDALSYLGEDIIEGVNCYVIQSIQPEDTLIHWINSKSFLKVGMSSSTRSMFTLAWDTIEGIVFDTRINMIQNNDTFIGETYNYKLNEDIPDSLFDSR